YPLFLIIPPSLPSSLLFPYTTLFRSCDDGRRRKHCDGLLECNASHDERPSNNPSSQVRCAICSDKRGETERPRRKIRPSLREIRSEEHTSELQSRENLVCRLLLEKKK